MKSNRCLCHVVLLPQEGNSVNCDQAFFFPFLFFFWREKVCESHTKSERRRTRDRMGYP